MPIEWAKAALSALFLVQIRITLQQGSDGLPLNLPDGFEISVYASVPGARAMAGAWVNQGEFGSFGGGHVTYVGTGSSSGRIWEVPQESKVHAIVDKGGDGVVDDHLLLLSGGNPPFLFTPSAVALSQDSLFVADVDRVVRFDNAHAYAFTGVSFGIGGGPMNLPPNPGVEILSSSDLPSAFFPTSQHRWKYMRIDPLENILYLAIGHPCNGYDVNVLNQENSCYAQSDPRHGAILAFSNIFEEKATPHSSKPIVAKGLRNCLGLDWHPVTRALYLSNNGRDNTVNSRGGPDNQPDGDVHLVPDIPLGTGESLLSQSEIHDAGNPLCYSTIQDLDLHPELRIMPGDSASFPGSQIEWLPDPELEGFNFDCNAMGYTPVRWFGNWFLNLEDVCLTACASSPDIVQGIAPLGPHVVPLGIRFYDRDNIIQFLDNNSAEIASGLPFKPFPPEYQNALIITEHGSWNRNPPNGYRVVTLQFDSNDPSLAVSHDVFIDGWLAKSSTEEHCTTAPSQVAGTSGPNILTTNGCSAWGRPNDVEILPTGPILISDDLGQIYIVKFTGSDLNDTPPTIAHPPPSQPPPPPQASSSPPSTSSLPFASPPPPMASLPPPPPKLMPPPPPPALQSSPPFSQGSQSPSPTAELYPPSSSTDDTGSCTNKLSLEICQIYQQSGSCAVLNCPVCILKDTCDKTCGFCDTEQQTDSYPTPSQSPVPLPIPLPLAETDFSLIPFPAELSIPLPIPAPIQVPQIDETQIIIDVTKPAFGELWEPETDGDLEIKWSTALQGFSGVSYVQIHLYQLTESKSIQMMFAISLAALNDGEYSIPALTLASIPEDGLYFIRVQSLSSLPQSSEGQDSEPQSWMGDSGIFFVKYLQGEAVPNGPSSSEPCDDKWATCESIPALLCLTSESSRINCPETCAFSEDGLCNDHIPPIIKVNGKVLSKYNQVKKCLLYEDKGVTISDNYDNQTSLMNNLVVSTSQPEGQLPLDTSKIGKFTIYYDVADEAGNVADTRSRVVKVKKWAKKKLQIKACLALEDSL